MKGLVVVPAYNEEKIIESVLNRIPSKVGSNSLDIVVIDDGSSDKTFIRAKKGRVKVLRHPVNRGLGAALGTGFEYAKGQGYDFLITLDADGQHDPKEISAVIGPILKGKADFVVGSRVNRKGMPTSRKMVTFMASVITYLLTGVWTSDSQGGFRAFSRKAIDVIKIEVDRMEVSSEFFRQARVNNLKLVEVSITPIYTEYSIKKGQNYLNSANIVGKLILRKFL